MCNSASFIVTQNDVFFSKYSDSHEDIISENKLNDKTDTPDFVRIEISPKDNDYRTPIESWIFKTDQDFLPEWFNIQEAEIACRDKINEWAKTHIIRKDTKIPAEFTKLNLIILSGNVTIDTLSDGCVQSYETTKLTINTLSGGDVRSYDTTKLTINTVSSGDVRSYNTSKVTINTVSSGYVRSYDTSKVTINTLSGGDVRSHHTSNVTIDKMSGGDVWSYNKSKVTIDKMSGGDVWSYNKSKVTIDTVFGGDVQSRDTSKLTIKNDKRITQNV